LPPPPLTSVPIDAQLLLTSTHRRSNCSRPLLSSPLHANSLLSSYGSCHVVPLRLLPYHHHSPPSGHPSPLRLHVICLDAQLNRSCHPPSLAHVLVALLPSFFHPVTSSHYVFCPMHHHHSPPSVPHPRPSPLRLLRLHVIYAQPLLPLPLVSSPSSLPHIIAACLLPSSIHPLLMLRPTPYLTRPPLCSLQLLTSISSTCCHDTTPTVAA
jgi:hypothetical protein